jgi:hypothetical protein
MHAQLRRPILLLSLFVAFLDSTAALGHSLRLYQRARIHAATPEPLRGLLAPLVPPA